MYINFVSIIAGTFRGLFERVVRLEEDSQRKHAIIVHYSAYRWCDATERVLSNELIGRGGWLTHSSVNNAQHVDSSPAGLPTGKDV
jgi:hypothetical protein